MGDDKRRVLEEWSPAYLPQGDEKSWDEFRGIANRGLSSDRHIETEVVFRSDPAAAGKIVIGCEAFNLSPLPEKASRPQIVGFLHLANILSLRNETACLLRKAAVLQQSLSSNLLAIYPEAYFDIVERLLDIRKEVEKRTQGPYEIFPLRKAEPLPKDILGIEPLPQYKQWELILKDRQKILTGKTLILDAIPIKEQEIKIQDKQTWQIAMQKIEDEIQTRTVQVQILAASVGPTAVINGHLESLKLITFKEIARQTGVKMPLQIEDDPVLKDTEVVLYHSNFSVLLDNTGEPKYLEGLFPFALLIPEPGSPMMRNLQPEGLYLSTGRLADQQFTIDGRRRQVRKILSGGIGGFSDSFAGKTWQHEVQQELQSFINASGMHFIAAITAQAAFSPGSLSLGAVQDRFPMLFNKTLVYTAAEIGRRLEAFGQNYQDLLKTVGEEVVKSIVIDKVKSFLIEFLIKKIGAKVIPVVNFVTAISELFKTAEHEMIRAALCCALLAIRGRLPDDLTISAKILSKIAADKVEAKVVSALVQKGAKFVKKGAKVLPSKSRKPQTQDSPPSAQTGSPPQASDSPSPDPATKPAAEPASKASAKTPAGDEGYDVLRDSTPDELARAAQMGKKVKQQGHEDKPGETKDTAPPKLDTGGPTRKPDDADLVLVAPGVYRRRRSDKDSKRKPTGTPTQPRTEHDEDHLTDENRSTATDQKDLTNKETGYVNDVRRSRHVRDRKDGNWDRGDSKALARNMREKKRLQPGAGFEAHHIIPGNEPESQNLVKILATKGVGINEEFNGVWLPRGPAGNVSGSMKHEFTFSTHPEYFTLLNGLITERDSADAIRGKIRTLGHFLEKGDLPTYQQVIDRWKGRI